MSSAERVTLFRQRRKDNLIRLCGGKCVLCGYNKCNAGLEFHHINPETKKFGLSSGNCHKIEDDIAEVKKCILICANCHREIHNGFYQGEDLFKYQFIDKDFEQELLTTNKAEQRFCLDCGKPITPYSKSGLCTSCVQKHRQKVENKPNRQELKDLIRSLPFTQIAEKYHVSDNAVRKWCDKVNLPRTKKVIEAYTDEQWLKI